MAERRMFAKTITNSDAFLDMPLSTQALYFHLNMNADDDGFINKPKSLMRMVGCCEDDFKLLLAKSFLIPFESGVVVIKHWRINNWIRNDRKHDTNYKEELARLEVKNNGAYTLCQTIGCQVVGNLDTEYSIGKVSIGKDNNTHTSNAHVCEDIYNYLTINKEEYTLLATKYYKEYLDKHLELLQNYLIRHPNQNVDMRFIEMTIMEEWFKKENQILINKNKNWMDFHTKHPTLSQEVFEEDIAKPKASLNKLYHMF